MEAHPIAKILADRGVDSVSLSMFSNEQKKEIYAETANILVRHNKFEQAFIAMERAGLPLPIEQLKRMAENRIALGQYQEAYDLLMRTGQREMADFVKKNFL
ncbi:hypothetical protein HZB90_03930 [archaeon]|nr:hypothetical protein [archaeon]